MYEPSRRRHTGSWPGACGPPTPSPCGAVKSSWPVHMGNARPRLRPTWGVPPKAGAMPSGLRYPWTGLLARAIAPAQTHPLSARCRQARTMAGAVARQPTHLWQTPQHLDPAAGCRNLLGTRPDALPSQPREDPAGTQALGSQLVTSQAVDDRSRPPICPKQKRRDRLIALAARHPDGVLGLVDKTWGSRLAQPTRHAWTAGSARR